MNARPPQDQRPDAAALDEAVGLLDQAFAVDDTHAAAPQGGARERLLARVHQSAESHRALLTVRRRHRELVAVADGVTRSLLFTTSSASEGRRPGEALSLSLLELAPGACVEDGLALAGHASEWLVLRGDLLIDSVALGPLDQRVRPATAGEPRLTTHGGALVYLRDGGAETVTESVSCAADARWRPYAPGIERRVLWERGVAVAFIARAIDGALVPPHAHLLDEECLMLEGDLFTGDILLREGEFQLAPSGFNHGVVQAASDCVVYIRGDAQVQVLPTA